MRAIIGAFSDHELGALVLFSIATGARQGEALGLRWPDCDLDAGSVTIRYQLQRIDGENRLTEPKTAKSRRTLPISPTVVETLRRQQRWQTEQRLRAGAGWQDSGHVFTTPNGAPLNGASVTHRFQKRLAQAELPRLRWHDLRHGCASLLLAQGADLRTIMELLGHSQISLTANLYTHLIPALKRDASDRMERVLTGSQASLPLSFYQ